MDDISMGIKILFRLKKSFEFNRAAIGNCLIIKRKGLLIAKIDVSAFFGIGQTKKNPFTISLLLSTVPFVLNEAEE